MDDISSTIALEVVQFVCKEKDKLGTPRGCFTNPLKTRILTSCDGYSILLQPHKDSPGLTSEIEKTFGTYSITYNKVTNKKLLVELVDRFWFLGTPIGSHSFACEYYNKQISAVTTAMDNFTKNITDPYPPQTIYNLHNSETPTTFLTLTSCTTSHRPLPTRTGITGMDHSPKE